MKQVKYFCDICKKEIKNPKAEKDCMHITMAYSNNWEIDLPISEHVKDIHVCRGCGEEIKLFINKMTIDEIEGGN